MSTKTMTERILEGIPVRSVVSEATTKKVVRNGKIKTVKVGKKKKRFLTAAQKRAIRKAQKASRSASARSKRRASMRKRKTFEGVDYEPAEVIICPACGSSSVEVIQDTEEDVTLFVCNDCGELYSLVPNDALMSTIQDEDDPEDYDDLDDYDDPDIYDDPYEEDEDDYDEDLDDDPCDDCDPDEEDCAECPYESKCRNSRR